MTGPASKFASLAWRSGTFARSGSSPVGHLKSLSQGSFVLQQLQRQLGRSGYESLWGAAVRTTSTQTQQHMALVRYWEALESRMSCFWAGLSLSNAGQRIIISMLPVAVVSQLFPGRFRGLALEIAPSGQMQPRPCDLMALTARPSFIQRLLYPQFIATFLHRIHEELLICMRGVYLSLLFLPAAILAPFAAYSGGPTRAAWLSLMVWTLQRAGPAFIKWGQWASTRPDLFPPDLCEVMEQLQTSAPSHSAAYTRARIRQSLRQPVEALFDSFEDEPVASGSIAQVHRATLSAAGAAAVRSGRCAAGTTVAVKVRHPGVTQLMQHDFVLMERAAKLASSLPGLSDLRLEESIRQFGGPLKEQLDLAVEASHLSRFKHNFRLWPNVSFPTPLYPYVSSDVLVESFENGALISKYVNMPTYAHRETLAETGLKTYLQMLLKDNFIHADLHPGNILVKDVEHDKPRQASGGGWLGWLRAVWPRGPPQLVLLDTGMIAELSQSDQRSLISFFKALTKQDGESLGNAILNMSERYTCKDPDAFVADLKQMFDHLDPEYIHKHTSAVIESIIDTIREHQVTLRSAVSTVVVTTLVLEGWSSKLHPDLRMLDTMRDMLLVDFNERISRTVDKIMSNGSLAVM